MATAFPYSFTRTKHLTLCPPSSHGGDAADHQPLPWILLDVRAYIADRRNSTTATIVLSNGRKIQITFCIAPPPLVSYVCAWSPTTDPAVFFAKEPAVGFVNDNLVFLRVHSDQIYDLIYHASSRPSLKLIHNPYSPYNPYDYLRRIDNVVILPDRRHAAGADDDDNNSGHFYVSSLDRDHRFDIGHFKLCLYDEDDSMDCKWSNNILLLDQLRNAPDKDIVLHLTEKVLILDDEQPLVAFVDPWRGMVICNVLDNSSTPGGSSYMPMPSEIFNIHNTRNACLLPKLDDGCPTTETLQLAHPTLSLMDAHIVYIMGKVDVSDEKALVLTVDMANKRLQEVSVYDAERIVNDFDYAYTQSTISQYFTTAAAGLKRNLKRPLKFHMQYPHKRQGGPGSEIRDETEDGNNPMDLD